MKNVLVLLCLVSWPSFMISQLHSSVRSIVSINDGWSFAKGDWEDASKASFLATNWQAIHVPHTWNDRDILDEEPGYYQGPAWYRRELQLGKGYLGKRIFLYFEGVNQEAEIYVNGQQVGLHRGGYTRFAFDVTDYVEIGAEAPQQNIVAIKVDNSFNEEIPPLSADFTFFGGIYRHVYLIATEAIHFPIADIASPGVFLQTPEVSREEAKMVLKGKIRSHTQPDQSVVVHSILRDQQNQVAMQVGEEIEIAKSSDQPFEISLPTLAKPHLWSPEHPYLYRLIVQIRTKKGEEVLDEVQIPVGFRWFSFDPDSGFTLNGKPYKLIGVNRHQDFEGLGNAVPYALQRKDLQHIKDMGANFLRIAHYPQQPNILEECDKLGIVTSVEIPIVNRITPSQAFNENSLRMQAEMIWQNYAHPSVVIWAYMNEVLLRPPMDPKAASYAPYAAEVTRLAQALEDLTREADPYRYTMIPNHGNFSRYVAAQLTEIPMIVGWNLYSGWYGGKFSGFGKFLDSHHTQLPHKPVIVTEYGAGADPRIRSDQPQRFDFSMEWSLLYHEAYLAAILNRPWVAGALIWNMADFQSEKRLDSEPHINSKGIMTLDRQPKDSYHLYQANLLTTPMISFGNKIWRTRAGIAGAAQPERATQMVRVYTNQPTVELIANGISLGKKHPQMGKTEWAVPFRSGANHLRAIGTSDSTQVEDVWEVDVNLFPASLKELSANSPDLCINVGAPFSYYDPIAKEVWLADRPYGTHGWGAKDGKAYYSKRYRVGSAADILGTVHDPVFQTQLTGLSTYQLDVPAGIYELSLSFAELLTAEEIQALPYELVGEQAVEESQTMRGKRVFSCKANDQVVFDHMNLAESCGTNRAVTKTVILTVEQDQGITIAFEGIAQVPILQGIRLHRIF